MTMSIYEHKTTLTLAPAAGSTTTLNIRGGLLRQVLIRAGSADTVFMANLTRSIADGGYSVLDYGVSTEEINDWNIALPVRGEYKLNITNINQNDTFRVHLGIEE